MNVCDECGNLFKPVRKAHRFCSKKCRWRFKRREYYKNSSEEEKEKMREYSKRWYVINKDKVIERKRQRLKEKKRKMVEILGGKCELCGYNKCLKALDFHHVDPTKKNKARRTTLSTLSWPKIMKEIPNLILFCANCHREVEAGVTSLPPKALNRRAL